MLCTAAVAIGRWASPADPFGLHAAFPWLWIIPALLATNAAYIGLIGSRRRWALTMKALREERGLKDVDFKRIYAPIGLELNAETPQEIAISIMAQITMLRHGGDGTAMRWTGDESMKVEDLIPIGKQ